MPILSESAVITAAHPTSMGSLSTTSEMMRAPLNAQRGTDKETQEIAAFGQSQTPYTCYPLLPVLVAFIF